MSRAQATRARRAYSPKTSVAAEPLAQSMMLREIRLDEPWARRRLLVGRREGPAPTAVQAVLEAIEAHAKRDGAE